MMPGIMRIKPKGTMYDFRPGRGTVKLSTMLPMSAPVSR